MSKLEGLPHVICITTDDAKHRTENFIKQCERYNITDYSIFSSPRFDSSKFMLSGKYIDKIHENSKGPVTSHIKAIKHWYDNSQENLVLILEDDVDLSITDYWSFSWKEFEDRIPNNYGCVHLCLLRDSFENIPIKFRSRLNKDWGCQAYLINREYAKKIIDKYYIDDYTFNLNVNDVMIQTELNQYIIYDLFPIIEHVLFEGLGNVYNFPLFIEDIINTNSNFSDSHDACHTNSYKFIKQWWENTGKNQSIDEIFKDIILYDPITVVQLGAHTGNDDLSRYLLKHYKSLNLGLFVEANPIHIEQLKNIYSNRYNNIIIENIAIKKYNDDRSTINIFYHDKDPDKQVASTDIEHVQKHEKFWQNGEIQSFEIQALNLDQLLDKYNITTIDWLLLDIEGMEPDIILNLDFSKYHIKKIEFEQLHLGEHKGKILDKLNNLGYYEVPSLHEYDIAFELIDNKYDIINKYALNPESPELNLQLAQYYHKLGHTGSAFTHYLRCSERTEDTDLAYFCLIQGFYCFDAQKNRDFTSSHLLKHAITICPQRPEAYFLLSRYYEFKKQWYESYTYASIGLELSNNKYKSLVSDVGYPGKFGLMFYKAVAGYWWDKIEESRILFNQILDSNENIPEQYISMIEYNLTEIEKKRQQHKTYTKNRHSSLRFKFDGSHLIEKNYSQAYQDLFILTALNGKQNGTYLEIGAGDPLFGNNSYLLENQYNWKGISIELNNQLVDKFRSIRKNRIIGADASKINYSKILEDSHFGTYIDYLQLDCDPPSKTFEILLSIPFDKYQFGIITYEHDYYLDMTRSYRNKSRNYLYSLGYKLIVNDISLDDSTPFEDWWIHPDLVQKIIADKLYGCNLNKITNIDKYLYY